MTRARRLAAAAAVPIAAGTFALGRWDRTDLPRPPAVRPPATVSQRAIDRGADDLVDRVRERQGNIGCGRALPAPGSPSYATSTTLVTTPCR